MSGERKRLVGAAVLLLVATVGLYARTSGHQFVNYDDNTYVYENEHVLGGLSLDGVRWAFGLHGYAANWHPLTWLSHMLDVQLLGLSPGRMALENALLHAASACLLLLFLARATRSLGLALFVAGVFALHPLRVESVAWVSERKEVLAGLFGMLALVLWQRHAERGGERFHVLVLLAAALGLMAKPTLVVLPGVLFLLDLWPLGRWRVARPDGTPGAGRSLLFLLAEKLPLLALTAGAAYLTFVAQGRGGAISSADVLTLDHRAANAALATVGYLGELVWPRGLACFYPHPWMLDPSLPALTPGAVAAGLALLGVTVLVLVLGRRRPWLAVGWLWYLVWLVPVVGLVQVGAQSMADRYTYFATVGPTLALAGEARALLRRRPALVRPAGVLGAGLVLACVPLAWRQVGTWRSSETLWQRALDVTEKNWVAHQNLGHAHRAAMRFTSAEEHYRAAVAIRPREPEALSGLGEVLVQVGKPEEAQKVLERCIRFEPRHPRAHANLALAYVRLGKRDLAEARYEIALPLCASAGERVTVLKNLGNLAQLDGRPAEAEARYREALALSGERPAPELLALLGLALLDLGRREEAQGLASRDLANAPDLPAVRELRKRLEGG